MLDFNEFNEASNPYIKEEIDHAKEIHKILQKRYKDIPKFPLIFKKLPGSAGGFISTTHTRSGALISIDKMVIDDSGMKSYDPDYAICHEWAHVILAWKTKNRKGLHHSRTHSNLTTKLAKEFGLI